MGFPIFVLMIPFLIVNEVMGDKLIDIRYEKIWEDAPHPYDNRENAYRVISGDFVTTDEGTGIVHTAPTFGADDALAASQASPPVPPLLTKDKNGQLVPLVNLQGKFIDNLKIIGGKYVKNEYYNENQKPEKSVDVEICIHLKEKNLCNLSGGEFQRVLLARAISKKPELLVLDEPVQGVDFTGEIALYELIKKISEKLNCGILLISHDLHTVMSATDHVVCLNGHVCCSGSPKDVARNNEYKALFGEQASQTLSVYEHKHDHEHSIDGKIKKN